METTTIVAFIREEACNRRLEIPIFAKEDPFGWLARAERYFLINGITDKDKSSLLWCVWREQPWVGFNGVRVVASSMNGQSLKWACWIVQTKSHEISTRIVVIVAATGNSGRIPGNF